MISGQSCVYIVGTRARKVELSLDELQKEAIFIPDSALTNLTEIGEGTTHSCIGAATVNQEIFVADGSYEN